MNRPLKRFPLTSRIAVAALLLGDTVFAQATKAKAQNVPEIPYDSVPNFLKLPPGLYMGEAMGVATNSKGHVFVFTRSAKTRLFEFDQNGDYVREIGEGNYGFEFAHSVRVDPQDNIWAVDEGTNMVIKFNPAGQDRDGDGPPAARWWRALSRRTTGPAPPAEKYTLGRPTDVAWDPQGNIFVSDGYTNHRVVKYDKNGRFLTQVGSEKAGIGAQPVQYAARHRGRRAGQRVRGRPRQPPHAGVRQQSGAARRFTTTSATPGRCASRPGRTSTCLPRIPIPTATRPGTWDITGEIYKMELDGTILGRFGHAGKELGGFQVVHMMDCRNPNQIIVAEIESWRVQKLMLEAAAAKAASRNRKSHMKTFFRFCLLGFCFAGDSGGGAFRCRKSLSIPRRIR